MATSIATFQAILKFCATKNLFRLVKVLRFIYFRQFKLTLGTGGYTQTLNTISFIECENLIELYRFIVMSQNGCNFRVFANTLLVNW